MPGESVQERLEAGITAVKSGNLIQGRDLLEAVLEVDERNESAWLWLSGAVETAEERQICLENVLAINPQNALAQKGLAKLAGTALADAQTQAGQVQTVTRTYAPLSTASALLYPESQTKTWEWLPAKRKLSRRLEQRRAALRLLCSGIDPRRGALPAVQKGADGQ